MKRTLLVLVVMTLCFGSIYSQSLKGTVINAATNLPLENVNISIENAQAGTVSDGNGNFEFRVEEFPVTVRFSAIGFENRTRRFNYEDRVTVYMVPVSENLSEVIVRGTLIPSELRKVPAAVSVISSEDLQRIDPTNLPQAFNNVPGVYVNQGALNTTKLNIRGIGARSQYSTNRIQAYFDGIPLTTAEGELTLDDIDPEALGRVEIIKGPTSSIYGAGLGGVINLYSEQPAANETNAEVKSFFGSYDMSKNSVSLRHGTENSRIYINFNDLQTNGYRENGEYSRQSGLANASLTTAGGNTLSFLANFTRLKAYIPSSINEEDFRNDPTTAAFTWRQSRGYESYDRGLLGASYLHNFSNKFSNLTSVYVNFRDAYEPRPFDILKEERVSAGARTQFNYDIVVFDAGSQLSFGAEYYKEWYEIGTFQNLYVEFEDRGSVLGERLSNNEQDRNYTNFFAQLRMELSERLDVEAGVNLNTTRYSLTDLFVGDEVDQSGDYTFTSILSPRVGVTYEVGTAKNIYASVSHGFSTPTVAETLTPEGLINTDLQPETGWNYEVGFKGNWFNNSLYSEVSLYSIQITDLLVAERIAEDQYVGINAGKTSHTGAEIFLRYAFTLA
ncbi:TonB-dependent receptor [Antarcticibacterium sp. 1MA-6-2]|uniref:TonB-dependent receptor n=1 Tax=Antarcticibacterium sp. 1MA-6-2 TaxID=2908210 RepID=UPI001F171B12|nr:TonB-dependent receptor [Antarcticibacterium sp. 1MA-6-2]UJH91124.1 TonB-dependent receptor [Antarcticibacterium sp. 1MA-6-2]